MSRSRTENIRQATLRPHQPGQKTFRAILPEEIDWKPFPAFPPSARLAIIVGQPSQAGPYTIRVKVPGGVKLMPHKHPEDRVYTVISGIFYVGVGNQFDTERLHAYPPGAVIILPGNTPHFHWAKSGEYITQVTAIGPLGLEYVNREDDPRNGRLGMQHIDRHRSCAASFACGGLPGDYNGGAGTAQLRKIAVSRHTDRQRRALPANDRTIRVGLE